MQRIHLVDACNSSRPNCGTPKRRSPCRCPPAPRRTGRSAGSRPRWSPSCAATPPWPPVPVPGGLADALTVAPHATYRTQGLGDLLTVLPDEATVRTLTPDLTALAALTDGRGCAASSSRP